MAIQPRALIAGVEIDHVGHRPPLTKGGEIIEEQRGAARKHRRLAAPGEVHRMNRIGRAPQRILRSEEHTSELQSLMRISYAVFCLKKKKTTHLCIYIQ